MGGVVPGLTAPAAVALGIMSVLALLICPPPSIHDNLSNGAGVVVYLGIITYRSWSCDIWIQFGIHLTNGSRV